MATRKTNARPASRIAHDGARCAVVDSYRVAGRIRFLVRCGADEQWYFARTAEAALETALRDFNRANATSRRPFTRAQLKRNGCI